jgi:hypothetical protein
MQGLSERAYAERISVKVNKFCLSNPQVTSGGD